MKKITQVILLFLFLPCLSHAAWTQLHRAVINGNLEQAQNLLDRGAEVDAAEQCVFIGYTPLHCASRDGYEAIAQLLLDRGANVNTANYYGQTPLHLAAHEGHGAIVQLLVDRGADVNAADHEGKTPLHKAATGSFGEADIAWLLIDSGAKVNAADHEGKTPLYWAECLNCVRHNKLIALLTCWQKLTKEIKDQMFAFLMATHPRLGAESPANVLHQHLSQHIWQFVKQPTIAELDQEILQQERADRYRYWVNDIWRQGGAVVATSAIAGLGTLGFLYLKEIMKRYFIFF